MVRDILASETDLEENLFGVRICMDAESRRDAPAGISAAPGGL